MAQTIDLGKVMLTNGGVWASGTTYQRLTFVVHEHDGWYSIVDTATEPTDTNPDWQRITNVGQVTTEALEAIAGCQLTSQQMQQQMVAIRAEITSLESDVDLRVNAAMQDISEAIDTANDAASNANTKAQIANVEATNARTQADYAKDMGDFAESRAEHAEDAATAAVASIATVQDVIQDTIETKNQLKERFETLTTSVVAGKVSGEIGSAPDLTTAVRYVSQYLTLDQKEQTRKNIGVYSEGYVDAIDARLTELENAGGDPKIGDMTLLKTTAKDKIVHAMNEIFDRTDITIEDVPTTFDEIHKYELKNSEGTIGTIEVPMDFINSIESSDTINLDVDASHKLMAYIKNGGLEVAHLGTELKSGWDKLDKNQALTTDATTITKAINEVDAHTDTNTSHIGDVTTLETFNKVDLVEAVNEVREQVMINKDNIGVMANLTTQDKTSLVNAMNEQETDVEQLKTDRGVMADLTTTATNLVGAANENKSNADARLRIIGVGDRTSWYVVKPSAKQNDIWVLNHDIDYEAFGKVSKYKAGTWMYCFDKNNDQWIPLNNGGGIEYLYKKVAALPTADIDPKVIYIKTKEDGSLAAFLYIEENTTWLQLNGGGGSNWIGIYNYSTTSTDPLSGQTIVTPWTGSPEQLAKLTAFVQMTASHSPEEGDLVTLNIDGVYNSMYIFKNNGWQVYSSMSQATKSVYGVTRFASVDDIANNTQNVAIDAFQLSKKIDKEFVYTKTETDDKLAYYEKIADLENDYYDKEDVKELMKTLQKAYVVKSTPADPQPIPELWNAAKKEQYSGSMVYFVVYDADDNITSNTAYIIDSNLLVTNLGEVDKNIDGFIKDDDLDWVSLTTGYDNTKTLTEHLDDKQDKVVGAATTILEDDLSKNRVVIVDGNGKIAADPKVTYSELRTLDNIQTDLLIEDRFKALTDKFEEDKGDSNKPIYLKDGEFVEVAEDIGSTIKPIYMQMGELKSTDASVGSSVKPIYMEDGEIKETDSDLGNIKKPIYMEGGELKECTATFVVADEDSVGEQTNPIYMDGGTLKACGDALWDAMFDLIYPVGSIYISVSSSVPSTFKGNWEQLAVGTSLWNQDVSSTEGQGLLGSTLAGALPDHSHIFVGTSHSHDFNTGTFNTMTGEAKIWGGGVDTCSGVLTKSNDTNGCGGSGTTKNNLKFSGTPSYKTNPSVKSATASGTVVVASTSNDVYAAKAGEKIVRPTSIAVTMWKRIS